MTRLTINTPTEAVEVRETLSGAYSVTNDQGRGVINHNFFTLEEAAKAALDLVLQVVAV